MTGSTSWTARSKNQHRIGLQSCLGYSRNRSGTKTLLAILIGSCLLSASKSVSIDRVYEIVPDAAIVLPEGKLSFLRGLKVFGYIQKTQAGIEATYQLFDSMPISNFAHQNNYVVQLPLNSAEMQNLGFDDSSQSLFGLFSAPSNEGGCFYLQHDTSSVPFPVVGTPVVVNDATDGGKYKQMIPSSDGGSRYLVVTSSTLMEIYKLDFGASRQASVTIPDHSIPAIVDQALLIGQWVHYIDKSGVVYIDDDTVRDSPTSSVETVSIAGFSPTFARIDSSSTCTASGCNVLVTEHFVWSNDHFLTSMLLQPSAATGKASLRFQQSVTALGLLSAPIQQAQTQRFTVLADSRFYVFKIYADRFEMDTEFDWLAVGGMLAGSLVVGEFDPAYVNRIPMMAVFTAGTDFTVKMFVYDRTACTERLTDQVCTRCVNGYKLSTTNVCEECSADGVCGTGNSNTGQTNPTGPVPSPSATPGCPQGSISYRTICVKCDTTAPSALVVENDLPKCIKTDASPYLEGYREVQITPFRVIEMCSQTGCKKCPADKDVCTECKDSTSAFNYATQRLDCALILTKWPKERVRRDIINNLAELLFESVPDPRPDYQAQVIDLDSNKVYSCSDVGCSMTWDENILKISFQTTVRVQRGQLRFLKPKTTRLLELANTVHDFRRQLEELRELIVVEDFQIMPEGWFFPTTKIVQILILFLRTVGSLVIFTTSPVSAMLLEWVIAHCVLLSLYLGRFLTTSEIVLQILGQIKVIWFWFPNPFTYWDSKTLTCAPRPNHGVHGLLCSFLDNSGHNVIGFAGLALLLYIFHSISTCGSHKSRAREDAHIRENTMPSLRLTYWVAKLDANQLEIMMYVLISYSLADSSSKSVVGLVLATILMLFFTSVAVGRTVILLRSFYKTPTLGSESTTARALPAKLASVHPMKQTGTVEVKKNQPIPKYQKWLAYTLVGMKPITNKWQTAGPILKLLRTFSVCILLLNHTSSPLLQLSFGLGIELVYLGSLFYTRSENVWFEFYGTAGIQLMVVLCIGLKLVVAATGSQSENFKDQISTTIAVVVLIMLLIACASMFAAFYYMRVESRRHRIQRQQELRKYHLEMGETQNKLSVTDELPSDQNTVSQKELDQESHSSKAVLRKVANTQRIIQQH